LCYMKVFVVDNGTTLMEKLKNLIPGDESVVCFDSFDDEEAEKADLIVLSGSSIGPLLGNEEKYQKEIDFIKNTDKPIIGICFGYELIVHAFGGTLKKLEEHELGEVEIKVRKDEKLFSGKKSFTAFENHRWGTGTLPEVFDVLATSNHGPEAIAHREKDIYGFQYHPENHPEEHFADEVFLNLFKRIESGS